MPPPMPQAWQACVWLGPQRREKTLARFVHHSPSEVADILTQQLQTFTVYWILLDDTIWYYHTSTNIHHYRILYRILNIHHYRILYRIYRHTAPKGSAVETIGIPWYPLHMATHKPSNLHQVTLHEASPLQGAGLHGKPPWIWSLSNGESCCEGTGTPLSAFYAMLILLCV